MLMPSSDKGDYETHVVSRVLSFFRCKTTFSDFPIFCKVVARDLLYNSAEHWEVGKSRLVPEKRECVSRKVFCR